MCGLLGFWTKKTSHKISTEIREDLLEKMAAPMLSRGPDGRGTWVHDTECLGMLHLRLAIIDTSDAGKQPMFSPSNRYVISFNGEVYNAGELSKDLKEKGFTFKGHSDTEVVLAAFEAYGIEKALPLFIGMFAMAVFDHDLKKLYLIRDRLGIKPLYYGIQGQTFLFSSQLKPLWRHPDWQGEINQQARSDYLECNYIPGTNSIFKGIQKVVPGTFIVIDDDFNQREVVYWSMTEGLIKAENSKVIQSDQAWEENLHALLRDSIRYRMVSDVPFGAFLSGGIDSSLVVALMQTHATTPTKTFTIGFHEDGFNEAVYAKKIAKHLKTDHHELYLSGKDALDVVPLLPSFYDEPFADSSQIPTYLVSKFAKSHVTVSLSGDGGDEFFQGYTRYHAASKIWNLLEKFPPSCHFLLKCLLKPFLSQTGSKALSPFLSYSNLLDKLWKLYRVLGTSTKKELYRNTLALWPKETIVDINYSPAHYFDQLCDSLDNQYSFMKEMQLCDGLMYLPDDIMTKVDRSSMAVSLEAREPLLDHRIIEMSWQIPNHLKYAKGQGKIILRNILENYIPRELFERPKQGFGVPLSSWLRGPLKGWASDLLNAEKLKTSGLNPEPILKRFNEHQQKTHEWHYSLWGILMYLSWESYYTESIKHSQF